MATRKPKIFSDLEKLAPIITSPVFWMDINGAGLGGNDLIFQAVGAVSDKKLLIGKTVYDYYPKDAADTIAKNIEQVIKEKRIIEFEEFAKDVLTKKTRYFLSRRGPLFDDNGIDIVGTIVTALEITERKEAERLRIENEYQKVKLQEQGKFKKLIDQTANDTRSPLAVLLILLQQCIGLTREEVFKTIREIADTASVNLYWFDENNIIAGANKYDMEAIGDANTNPVGMTLYELFPAEMADDMVKNNNLAMQTGKILSYEEKIKDITTGEIKYFTSFKAPLYDDNQEIIGVIGTSIDISAEKNAERLKLEGELQKVKIQEQETFKTVVSQVSHDIRSPLASLQNMVKACKNLPEPDRIALRHISERITDIANNLLGNYKKFEGEASARIQKPRSILVSLVLAEILSAKRQKYINSPIKFNLAIAPNCNLAFIKVDAPNFKRTIANLINNAVEAYDAKTAGTVGLKLEQTDEQISITLQDNGKGIPPEVLTKIRANIDVTAGKPHGSGIGLSQVRSTLKSSNGKMVIESIVGMGTKTILTFPKIAAPAWIVEQITLYKGDTVIILDDDNCVHDIWNERFIDYTNIINLKHFTFGNEVVDFINNHPEKYKLLLLSDFELIDQELNGVQIIEKTAMQAQAMLVTSHHESQEVRELAAEANIKILPKQLVAEVQIDIEMEVRDGVLAPPKKIDLVIIDDDQLLADSVANLFRNKLDGVEAYYNPNHFLKNLSQYSKDTIICMDHDFKTQINGLELAEQLHKLGFTKLYLFTGKQFAPEEIPDYLITILKGCSEDLNKIIY